MSFKHQKEAGRLIAKLSCRDIGLMICADGIQKQFEEAELDAFKAGAEWAANIHRNNDECYNKRMEVTAILTAANNLTEIPKQ